MYSLLSMTFLFITEVYLPLTITLHTPHNPHHHPPTLLVGLFLIFYILAPTHPHIVSYIDISPLLMDYCYYSYYYYQNYYCCCSYINLEE